ncbi:MAG: protein kinase [Candidatus Eisenbacteria bacterium]|nr:protein kinase [Candidatus Eisenbacteria bacterium]
MNSPNRDPSPGENPADLTGSMVGRYRVESVIGRGGMGEVYLATDTLLNRRVALKRIHRRRREEAGADRTALREARRAGKLADPRIAAVYDVLSLGNEIILVLEHVEGRTLRSVIAEKPPVEEFWSFAEECLQAFAVAHREGLLHRDIKPENIMITPAGGIKVLDFGLAWPLIGDHASTTLTMESLQEPELGGTPPYMAPETLLGGDVDERADIFSLGVTFYEFLAGTRPFGGPTPNGVTQNILHAEPKPLHALNARIPSSLSAVVMKMLAKDPNDRYASIEDVLSDIRRARGGAVIVQPQPKRSRDSVAGHGRRVGLLTTAALAVVLAGALLFGGLGHIRERFGLYALPSNKNVVILPGRVEGGFDEELSTAALGATSLLGNGLAALSLDQSLQVVPFMDTVRLGIEDPAEGRELQGANLVVVSSLTSDGEILRGKVRIIDPKSGIRLRTREVEAGRPEIYRLLKTMLAETADMLDSEAHSRVFDGLIVDGSEGAGTLQFYLEGLGRILRVLQGRSSVSASDTTEILAAIGLFERAAAIEHDHAPSLAGAARACRQMYRAAGDTMWLNRGEEAARRAVHLDDGLAEAHKRLAFILWDQGMRAEAVREMARAVALNPVDDVAISNLGGFYGAQGRIADEERVYREAADARPHHWYPHWWLATRVYYRYGRLEEARQSLEDVVRLAPSLYKGYQSLGGIQVLEGDYEKAVENLERSIALHLNAEALGNLGVAYFNLREFDQCIQTFNEVFLHKFADYEDWLNLGDAYYWAPDRRGKAAAAYGEAVRLGREKLRREPANAMIRANLAQIYPKIGMPDSARAYIEGAIAREPENPMIQYCAAVTFWQLGQPATALEWLGRSVAGGYPTSWLRDSPMFDAWRSEERFERIVDKTNIEG